MMASKLTQNDLKMLLRYDPSTGDFCWLVDVGKARQGMCAGIVDRQGYLIIRINNKAYGAHRLAWLYMHGALPDSGIDHINGKKTDNSIANLRAATQKENMQNAAKYKSNTSGFIGVSFNKGMKKYHATIKAFGKQKHLGYFDTAESASVAYQEAKRVLHTFNPEPVSRI